MSDDIMGMALLQAARPHTIVRIEFIYNARKYVLSGSKIYRIYGTCPTDPNQNLLSLSKLLSSQKTPAIPKPSCHPKTLKSSNPDQRVRWCQNSVRGHRVISDPSESIEPIALILPIVPIVPLVPIVTKTWASSNASTMARGCSVWCQRNLATHSEKVLNQSATA
jgi:hypothetical protein